MKLLDERNQMKSVAERWLSQYPTNAKDIYQQLCALNTDTAGAMEIGPTQALGCQASRR